MPANTFGEMFRITSFGESHGDGIGVVVDGCPAGFEISEADIQAELDRRRPGQSHITTDRNEADKVKILSGIYNGKTTGSPIAMVVFNTDQRSHDYNALQDLYRPGHSDFTYQQKYQNRDPRGGGRSSARIMIGRVAAGAIAKKFLKEKLGVEFLAYTSQVGEVKFDPKDFSKVQLESERLVFKPISFDYLEEIDTEFTDKVAKYIRLNQKSNESISKTAEFLAGAINKHNQNEELTFVVLEKETKEFLGVCSIHDVQTGNLSFGLWVKESSWGKGFGKEMIGALKDFVEENLNLSSLTYVAFEENLGSRKIAESFGGVEIKKELKGIFEDDGKEGVEITYQLPFENKKVDFYETVTSDQIEANIVRCPDPKVAQKMIELIEKAKAEKDSLGGVITGVIRGLPVGLGEPEFDKFPALLAHAMLSINATKGFEIGSGFAGTKLKGSQHNDEFVKASSVDKKNPEFEIGLGYEKNESTEKQTSNLSSKSTSSLTREVVEDRRVSFIPYRQDLEEKAKHLRKNQTEAEKLVWYNILNENKTGFKFLRQKPLIDYIVDFYCSELQLVVEIDDQSHDYKSSYDLKRTRDLEKYGITVIRYKNSDIISNLEGVKLDLKNKIKQLTIEKNHSNPPSFGHLPYQGGTKTSEDTFNQHTITTKTNHAGGVLGGITNGQTVYFNVAFKPVATIGKPQKTLDNQGNEVVVEGKGRHDPCVLPRAVPIVEAMSALVAMDLYLRGLNSGKI